MQKKISEYIYTEDDGITRVALASILATRMQIGDPVWVIIIGASSGGKSQILRPLALTDEKFMHRVDDLTENTFLSGMKVKKGEKEISLLKRIGSLGMIVISDFTVIFSKGSENRNAILSQFRMIYDGEMTKYSGTQAEPITWKGSLGVLAGSTPSIYRHFEEVADMGERFIYYRMKEYDIEKATKISLSRKLFGKNLDDKLSEIYTEYLQHVVEKIQNIQIPEIDEDTQNKIINISMFSALLRTPTVYDPYMKMITKIPVPEMPMRIARQLMSLLDGMRLMRYADTGNFEISDDDIEYIEWCAYSLANEERRACLGVLSSIPNDTYISTQAVADNIGLNTIVVGMHLQHLSAVGIVERTGQEGKLTWKISKESYIETIKKLTKNKKIIVSEREKTYEESDDDGASLDDVF